MGKQELIYKDLSYRIIGACQKIHNILGRYRNEKQYADAFETVLINNNIKYKKEFLLPPSFKGEKKIRNKVDFIVKNLVLLEFKASTILTKQDYFQTQRYLTSANIKLGLIINFRPKYLKQKRVINPNFRDQ